MRNHFVFIVEVSNLRADVYEIKGRTDKKFFWESNFTTRPRQRMDVGGEFDVILVTKKASKINISQMDRKAVVEKADKHERLKQEK
mmetsp:Transcript_12289/g.18801  ORF Transcript_12289/g.18801 Transcript_12289/m.18801 type:complete len:86 (-) Transcript_12289:123-380(-)